MATICFRPPPLPPNKKANNMNFVARNRNKQNHNNNLLSSTYLSFRDPAEDEIISFKEEIELDNLKCKNVTNKRCRRVSHTNSLCRSSKGDAKVVLARSHSDGNIDKKGTIAPMTINRYIKVLSGSWKNLLNCKLRFIFIVFQCKLRRSCFSIYLICNF